MASFEWTLCLLCYYLTAIHTESKSWTINVPPLVRGLPGSCVVIPCSFDFPDQKKKLTQFTGIWKDVRSNFIYHPDYFKIIQAYQNRTKLLGKLAQKDCSLEINPLIPSDQGPFHFRIDIPQLNSFSYIQNTVAISKINDLGPISLSVNGEVRDGQTTSVSCSITHSCPTSPPIFTWSHLGRKDVQDMPLEYGQQRTTSTLSFQPSREDHNKLLRCSIRYKGGQQQQNTTLLLKVKYVPEIRNVSHCTSGAKLITCVCIVESNPSSRLQFVLSDRILNSTMVKTNGTVTTGLLRVEQRPHTFIQCLASNTLGRANLTLSVTLLHRQTMTNRYFIAVGGGVLLLNLLGLAIAIKKWRRWTGALQTSRLKMDKVTTSYQWMRKENNVHGNEEGETFGCHVYENPQTYMYEAIYNNM